MDEFKVSLLELDLTTGKSRNVDMTEEAKQFLGGNGLGNKLVVCLANTLTDDTVCGMLVACQDHLKPLRCFLSNDVP